MTEKQWPEQLVLNIADEVKRLRKEKKMSVRALSEHVESLGYPMSESVLSNFEYGRRGEKFTVVELLVLAAALEVPPALLLFPRFPDGEVDHLPNASSTAFEASRWLGGEVMPSKGGELTGSGYPLVRLARGRDQVEESIPQSMHEYLAAQGDEEKSFWKNRLDDTKKMIRIQNREMRRIDGVVKNGEG